MKFVGNRKCLIAKQEEEELLDESEEARACLEAGALLSSKH